MAVILAHLNIELPGTQREALWAGAQTESTSTGVNAHVPEVYIPPAPVVQDSSLP